MKELRPFILLAALLVLSALVLRHPPPAPPRKQRTTFVQNVLQFFGLVTNRPQYRDEPRLAAEDDPPPAPDRLAHSRGW